MGGGGGWRIFEQHEFFFFKLVTNRWAWELVPKRLAGCQVPSCRGGIHGNPGTREPPKRAPANGTVTLKQSVEITYLKILTLMTQCKRGREERVQESAMIRTSKAFDPQRSADNTARVKQWTLKPCETSRGHPKGHVLQMRETAGCICSHFNFA